MASPTRNHKPKYFLKSMLEDFPWLARHGVAKPCNKVAPVGLKGKPPGTAGCRCGSTQYWKCCLH